MNPILVRSSALGSLSSDSRIVRAAVATMPGRDEPGERFYAAPRRT